MFRLDKKLINAFCIQLNSPPLSFDFICIVDSHYMLSLSLSLCKILFSCVCVCLYVCARVKYVIINCSHIFAIVPLTVSIVSYIYLLLILICLEGPKEDWSSQLGHPRKIKNLLTYLLIIDWFQNFPDEKRSFLLACE